MSDWVDMLALAQKIKRQQHWREAQRRRRAKLYAAGLTYRGTPIPPPSDTASARSHRKRRFKGGR